MSLLYKSLAVVYIICALCVKEENSLGRESGNIMTQYLKKDTVTKYYR